MMKNPHPAKRRILVLLGVFAAFLLLFLAALYDAQILHGKENRARSISNNATSETVPASRGIITDRNGKVLVSNRLAYTLVFDRSGFTDDAALNSAILRLIQLCEETRARRGTTRCPLGAWAASSGTTTIPAPRVSRAFWRTTS